MYIILLQMAQFYTQQAYGLWPQVWPVPDSKVIRDMSNFKSTYVHYRDHILNRLLYCKSYLWFCWVIFFLVGWLTVRNVVKN